MPPPTPHVSIRYCPRCRWMLRATWYAQELLSTFEGQIGAVSLVPAESGRFEITVDEVVVWDRAVDGGFPEAKVLKQRVRDRIDPGRDLGHGER